MELPEKIQEAMLVVLCYDSSASGAALIKALIDWKVFDPHYRDVAKAAMDYYDEFKEPPGEHTIDLIDELKADKPQVAAIYDELFSSMQGVEPNTKYVAKQAMRFARQQRVKRGVQEAIEILEQSASSASLDKVEEVLTKAMKHPNELLDRGIFFADTERSLRFLDRREDDSLALGIEAFDKVNAGPARKRLHLLMAMPKKGKSWWLIHLAKMALMQRWKVLYVTLELSADEVSQRLHQSIHSVAKREGDYKRLIFKRDEFGMFLDFDYKPIKSRPTLTDENIRHVLTEKTARLKQRAPICVKEFPTGSLSPAELESYLDAMEAVDKFTPDLMLVDYPDLMRTSPDSYRYDLGNIHKQLRGLAIKHDMAVAAVSQAQRSSGTLITEKNVAEDFSKIATADTVMSYNQTEAEHDIGLARLYLIVHRTDADKIQVLVSQCYALGQFCQDSSRMSPDYWNVLKEEEETNGADSDDDKPRRKHK